MSRIHWSRRHWERAAAGLTALTLGVGLVGGAMAANTVNTKVVGGTRTASIADLSLGSIAYSHDDQKQSGTMSLTADDSSGTNAGWNVTVLASDFAYSGDYAGEAIPSANFALTSAGDPTRIAGQGVSPKQGPMVPSTSPVGTLDVARKVVVAEKNHGKGTYGQELGVLLLVPADSVEGEYTSTITVTITAGP
ncbi:MAG: WxL domain-containing protein [Thermomicrobiales bacterium]|nr:WxL domain-containing protein [Thermomicrobiales bacterium]